MVQKNLNVLNVKVSYIHATYLERNLVMNLYVQVLFLIDNLPNVCSIYMKCLLHERVVEAHLILM